MKLMFNGCYEKGWKGIIVEADSQVFVDLILWNNKGPWCIAYEIKKILPTSSKFRLHFHSYVQGE